MCAKILYASLLAVSGEDIVREKPFLSDDADVDILTNDEFPGAMSS